MNKRSAVDSHRDRGHRENHKQSARANVSPETEHQHDRPHHVELFFLGERPEMNQGAHLDISDPERRYEILRVSQGRGDEAECREDGAAIDDPGRESTQDNGGVNRKHADERRQQSKRASTIESAQRDPSALTPLLEQERRDQEAAQDKEEIDSEQTTAGKSEEMHSDHAENRNASNAVQRRPVSELDGRRRRHRLHRPVGTANWQAAKGSSETPRTASTRDRL